MGHAITNKLIGVDNKTLEIGFFFFKKTIFSQKFKFSFGQMMPKKRIFLKKDSYWLDVLSPLPNSSQAPVI